MVNYVWVQDKKKETKLNNLLLTGVCIGFIRILFHFTIVFFFGLMLESVLLVWIFLALWNAVALMVDIPIWVLQKYIKPKVFLIIANSMMLMACLIFLKFIYFEGLAEIFVSDNPSGFVENTISWTGRFFDSTLNIVLLAVAAGLYGTIKESFDITTLSYIFNNTTPGEYAKYISRYNIHFWIGSFVGLIFSGVLLSINIKIAIIIFIWFVICFFLFLLKFFDNTHETIDLHSLRSIKLDSFKVDLWKQKNTISQTISTKNLKQITEKTKVIFLKPVELKKSIDFSELFTTTAKTFKWFFKMITWKPRSITLMWIIFLVMQFSFWDTFVATFQVEFLEKLIIIDKDVMLIKQTKWLITWYVLLWVMVIPAFVFQDFFIKMSKKFGQFNIIMFGSLLSALSLILFGFFSSSLYMIMLLGILNSIWYAAVFPISQAVFSERYNLLYAKRYKLKQIDSTISAAPLMIVLNSANVIGLLFGSFIVKFIWFEAFFIIFWGLLLGIFIFSILKYDKINDSDKDEDESENADESIIKNQKIEEFDGEVF